MMVSKMGDSGMSYKEGQDDLKKPLFPYRYYIMFMLLLTTMVVFSVRCTINVAVVAMVGPSKGEKQNGSLELDKKYLDWDQNDQGIALGAYFYTYSAIQVFAGLLTDKFNIVYLFGGTQVLAIMCTFVTPAAAKLSLAHLVLVRMILGLVHGVTFPTLYNLIENWFPSSEIGLAQGLMAGGCDFGTALISLFTAWISQKNIWGGWPAVFYIIGFVNTLFTVIWFTMVTVDPQSNRFVSEYEKRELFHLVPKKVAKKQKRSTPWIPLLTSMPLWSVIITKGLIGTAYSVISSKIPVYLADVLHFELQNNGAINGILYIAVGASQLTCGPVSKYIITAGWLSKNKTRKLFESIALSGIIASLVTVCYSGDHPQLIVACLVLSMFFYGFNLGGDVPMIPEMAPGLVGTAYGLSNTLACAAGFIAPALIGAILGDDGGSKSKWILAFQITAGLQLIGLILFNVFGTTDPQPWGKLENDDDEKSSSQPQSVETVN